MSVQSHSGHPTIPWRTGIAALVLSAMAVLTPAQLPAGADMATRWDYAQYPCEVWAESNHTSTQYSAATVENYAGNCDKVGVGVKFLTSAGYQFEYRYDTRGPLYDAGVNGSHTGDFDWSQHLGSNLSSPYYSGFFIYH
jgi:hypothetical protein